MKGSVITPIRRANKQKCVEVILRSVIVREDRDAKVKKLVVIANSEEVNHAICGKNLIA
jgi:hypothetical protein